jgi:acyl-CoA reductase-like NAD-dependent aldehyde dehydrogenase
MITPALTIGGRAVSATSTFDVVDPAHRTVVGAAPDCTAEQLDAAFLAAKEAFRTWREDEKARCAALHAAADRLVGASDEIGRVLTREQGKALRDATGEVLRMADWLRYYADLELPREVIQDDKAGVAEVVRRPIGVVAAITPWNFPLTLAAWKVAPALRAGNTVVLKPSPYTPLSTLLVGEVLCGVLPDGVLNVVSGGDELGAAMVRHPVPRKISFTGSVGGGRAVNTGAAPDLKRVTLELGGNDPAILLDDIDIPAVAKKLFWASFTNNGQICSAVKRVYVPKNRHDELIDALVEVAGRVVVGDGLEPATLLGPVNNRAQFERVTQLVADAEAAGAKLIAGHAPELDGWFVPPTIVAGARDGMRLVDEEQFGPALPVVPYSDLEAVVERINDGPFGLGGSVWGSDSDRAAAVASRLECGTAWTNTHLVMNPHQPFGGFKASGIGVENGPWGLYAFTELQVLYRARQLGSAATP